MSEAILKNNILKCDFSIIAFSGTEFSVYFYRLGKYECTMVNCISEIFPFVIDTDNMRCMTINVWDNNKTVQVDIHPKGEYERLDHEDSINFLIENSTFGELRYVS